MLCSVSINPSLNPAGRHWMFSDVWEHGRSLWGKKKIRSDCSVLGATSCEDQYTRAELLNGLSVVRGRTSTLNETTLTLYFWIILFLCSLFNRGITTLACQDWSVEKLRRHGGSFWIYWSRMLTFRGQKLSKSRPCIMNESCCTVLGHVFSIWWPQIVELVPMM